MLPAMPRDAADPLVAYWGPMARAIGTDVDLEVIALRFPSALPTYRWGRARVHCLPHGHLRRRRSPLIWRSAVQRLEALHRERPFSLIHALHGNEAGWVGALASLRLRLPLLVHLGGGEPVGLTRLAYGSQCHALERWQVATAVRLARRVTVGSAYQGQRAADRLGLNPARISVLPIGLDLAAFAALRDRGATAPVAERFRRIIDVAELNAVKGHDLLLRAAQPWLHSLPGLRLALVGGGPKCAGLRRQAAALGIADRIDWHGQVPNGALPQLLARADVFAHSALHEAQGLALIEAAAAGLPIASSRVGVTTELGVPNRQLAHPGDVDGLRAAIGQALARAWDRDVRPQPEADRARACFSLETVAPAWQRLYAGAHLGVA